MLAIMTTARSLSFAETETKPEVLTSDQYHEILKSRDPRFDGMFFVGVSTTGIYCRPVCRVRLPRADRCNYFRHAASAEQAGYRPCLRCRPELAPGNSRNDALKTLAQKVAAKIQSGALIDESIETLAQEFSISSRQVRRAIQSEFGVSPIALAQTYRLLMAKQLLTDTKLKITDLAFASGFSSVRQFNYAFKKHYGLNPSTLRKKNKLTEESAGIILRLAYRPPLAWQQLIEFLASRSAGYLDQVDGSRYSRSICLGDHRGWFTAWALPEKNQIIVEVSDTLLPCLTLLKAKLRFLFDLDANPVVVESHLLKQKVLKPIIKKLPGLRVPGAVDGFELALRAVLGQQISVKAATTIFGRFVTAFGEEIKTPFEKVCRLAPRADIIANQSLETIVGLGLTRKRAETVLLLARAVFKKEVNLTMGADAVAAEQALLAIRGIGPWTAQYIAIRAFADADALPDSDLGLFKALNVSSSKEVIAATEKWRPWRAYGALYLWSSLNSGG